MALLTESKRKEYFEALGFGEYNKANILKFQKKYFTRAKDHDGLYGPDTDNLLRHCYNVKAYAGKNFKPEEFRCGCGRKYCTGYPTYMKAEELKHLQTIRTHYGKPMEITSGLRCKGFNSRLSGASSNSKHLTGYAADFYIKGVTDTLARRKSAIAYIKGLPNHNWTYGNGWCSKGYKVSAPNMGNALHTDTIAEVPKAKQIANMAISLCGSKTSPTTALKNASKAVYGNTKNLIQCHVFVGIVLGKCGYAKMPVNKGWSGIFSYLRSNFTEIKVNYTESQLKPGDIRIHKNASGHYHIWIITKSGQRAEANSVKKYYPHLATNKASTKHKGDWLFRAK